MDPAVALRELGGVGTLRELLAYTNRSQLSAALADGRIHKPRHNRYCLADLDGSMRAVARTGGTASHLSAAQQFGWKLKHDPVRPCITLPRSARKPAGAYELHWADLSERELRRNVTSRTRTVIDCARAYDFDVALCVADSALREGIIDADDLAHRRCAQPAHGPGQGAAGRPRCLPVAGQPVRDLPPRDRDVGAGPRRRSAG